MNSAMRSQYHNIHHPNAPTRGRPGPVPVVPNLQAQQQREKQIMEAREKEKAQRRAFKPADKNMPDGIDDFIIGDGIRQYKRMREFERKLDAMLMRKRFDMVDTRQNVVTRYKKMRIWISNTFDVQSRPGEGMDHDMYDLSGISEGMFRMKIEGCLLDDDDDDKSEDSDSDGEKDDKDGDAMDQDAQPTQKPIMPAILQPKTKLSHFFKEININPERSKNVQPDSMTQIVWRKPEIENTALVLPPEADFDSLEIERKIDAPVNCTINLFRDDLPKRYLLTEPLAELLDTRIEDRRTVLLGLHDYIRAMNLQKDEEKRAVQCDERLRKIFNRDVIFIPNLPELILPHLNDLPPITLPYTIHCDPSFHPAPSTINPPPATIYDITLPVIPSPLPLPNPPNTSLHQLASHDNDLALAVQALHHAKGKHAFMTEFERDPVGFLGRWMRSQQRDLEVVVGDGVGMGKGEWGVGDGYGVGPEWRRGGKEGVWGRREVLESVGLMKHEGTGRA